MTADCRGLGLEGTLRGDKESVLLEAGAREHAVYNSPIAGMLTPSSSRRVLRVLVLPILLFFLPAAAQELSRSGAEEHLAAKVVAVTGARAIRLEVSNRSSLDPTSVDDIRRQLSTRLSALGARVASGEPATATVQVSLSENPRDYLWVAEIHRTPASVPIPVETQATDPTSSDETTVVMVSWPRFEMRAVEPVPPAMVLRKTLLWTEPDRILDVAIVSRSPEGNPSHMLVLDSQGVEFYRLENSQWKVEQVLAVAPSRPWPRDWRGRLVLRSDHFFDAYLPGVSCRSTASPPLEMTCRDGDDAWPIGTGQFNLSAPLMASRNYFSGSLLPGIGRQMTTAAFYSAAAIPQGGSALWLFSGVDGQVHMLDGATDQALESSAWGSDIAVTRSGCGSGWQVLVTSDGQGPKDTVRAFEVHDRRAVAASAALEVEGRITGFWSETGGTEGASGVVAVVQNSKTGAYEAFRLTVTCGR